MKSSIVKIYALIRFALPVSVLLLAIGAAAAAAQTKNESVFAFNTAPPNTEDRAAADYAINQFLIGLMEQYPCVDTLKDSEAAALVGLERWKDLLGAARDDQAREERLREIAGAIGARYPVAFKATTLPNGQMIISAVVFDGRTGQMIANRLEQSGGGKDPLQTAEAVAKSILQDLSAALKGRCDVHWTGNIAYTRLIRMSTQTEKSGAGRSMQTSETKTINLTATVNIVLQPMTLGSSGKSGSQARVAQNYRFVEEFIEKYTTEIPCREPGRNTYYKKVSGDTTITKTGNGSETYVVNVSIRLDADGKYTVQAAGRTIKVKGTVVRKGTEAGCQPMSFSSTAETENPQGFYNIDLKGQVDPNNPSVLSGKTIKGDLETGQETWTWSLRLVDPNRKK